MQRYTYTGGNQYTGDLAGLDKLASGLELHDHDNWVQGDVIGIPGMTFCAKIYNEPSEYGIKGGRISKLTVCTQKGWDSEDMDKMNEGLIKVGLRPNLLMDKIYFAFDRGDCSEAEYNTAAAVEDEDDDDYAYSPGTDADGKLTMIRETDEAYDKRKKDYAERHPGITSEVKAFVDAMIELIK